MIVIAFALLAISFLLALLVNNTFLAGFDLGIFLIVFLALSPFKDFVNFILGIIIYFSVYNLYKYMEGSRAS